VIQSDKMISCHNHCLMNSIAIRGLRVYS